MSSVYLSNECMQSSDFMMITRYHKIPKNRTPEKFAVIVLKFEQSGFTIAKDVDGIASSLIWVYTVCPDLSI